MLPEVVLLAQTHHMRGVYAHFLRPDIVRLIVVLINGNIQLILGQLEHLSEEFPRPRGRLALEIVAEREVTQHLKKGAVARGNAHALNVGSADTLLAGGDALARRCDLACEILLHGSHSAVDQQKAVVVLWNQRKAGKPETSLRLKKREELFTQFV